MTKKALCVGINDYPIAGMDLKGCVNDAKAWSALLRKQYDFTSADVRVLLDKAATHEHVTDGLKALLAGARSGDVLVFTNSSHGTYVADDGRDEADRYDEAMCPYDCKTAAAHRRRAPDAAHRHPPGRATHGDLGLVPLRLGDQGRRGPGHPRRPAGSVPQPPQPPPARDQGRPEPGDATTYGGAPRVGDEGAPALRLPVEPVQLRRAHRTPLPGRHVLLRAAGHQGRRLPAHVLGPATRLREALAVSNYDQEPQLEGKPSFKRRQIFT